MFANTVCCLRILRVLQSTTNTILGTLLKSNMDNPWSSSIYFDVFALGPRPKSGFTGPRKKPWWDPEAHRFRGFANICLTAQQEPHSSRASSGWRQHQRSDSWRMELADWLSLRVRSQGIHPWDPWDPKGGIITSLGWRASGCWYERGINRKHRTSTTKNLWIRAPKGSSVDVLVPKTKKRAISIPRCYSYD